MARMPSFEVTGEMLLRQHQRDRVEIASRLLGRLTGVTNAEIAADQERARAALVVADSLLKEAGDVDRMLELGRTLGSLLTRLTEVEDQYAVDLARLTEAELLTELQRRVFDLGVAAHEERGSAPRPRTERGVLACALVLGRLSGGDL